MKKQQRAFLIPATTTSLLFMSLFFLASLGVSALPELNRSDELGGEGSAAEVARHGQEVRITAAQHDAMRGFGKEGGSDSVVVEKEESSVEIEGRQQFEPPIHREIATAITNILRKSRIDCDKATRNIRTKQTLREYQDLKDYYEQTEYFTSLAIVLDEERKDSSLLSDSEVILDLLKMITTIILVRENFLQACREDATQDLKSLASRYRGEEEAFWKSVSMLTGLSFNEIKEITQIATPPKKSPKRVTFSWPLVVSDPEPDVSRSPSSS